MERTVANLSTMHAAVLLDVLVERLQHQPQQAARLMAWLRNLLLTHGLALAATPKGQVGALACLPPLPVHIGGVCAVHCGHISHPTNFFRQPYS